jgi:hypothetical protein
VIGGGLKIVYDLALLALFHRVKPPEEQFADRGPHGSAKPTSE